MKYFSERLITKSQVDMLKKSRKKYVYQKLTNHNDNFLQISKFEIPVPVVDHDDELLRLIKEHLEPRLDDYWVEDYKLNNYRFRDLPPKLKAYMRLKDSEFFNKQYHAHLYSANVEDYETRLERLEKMYPEYTQEQLEDHVLLGKPFPSTVARKAKESARTAYRAVNELLKCNIDRFTTFVTLTFALEENNALYEELNDSRGEDEYDLKFTYVDPTDFEACKAAYSKMRKALVRKLKDKGIELDFLTVWELTKKKRYHFHMLCSNIPEGELYDMPAWLDTKHGDRVEGKGLRVWKHGKSDVQKIKSPAQMSTYLSKYILKSFYELDEEMYESYKGKRKYFPSDGLVRATKGYVEDDYVRRELERFELLEEQPYTKEIINPYNNGLITNQIYTIIKNESPDHGEIEALENLQVNVLI